ncbi:MAG: hypothetical protein C4547_02780 [Phycisphaerales bacterium]|nr:MAG: hypothetical protein C4547_02780 [Phycisphaerales bacterium]
MRHPAVFCQTEPVAIGLRSGRVARAVGSAVLRPAGAAGLDVAATLPTARPGAAEGRMDQGREVGGFTRR